MSQYSGAMASMASTNTEATPAHTPENDSDRKILPQPWLSVVCLFIPLAILTAVGGNLLIMLSYKRDALLRSVHNLYLLHLAVCDFFIGSVSMPFYLVYTGEFVSARRTGPRTVFSVCRGVLIALTGKCFIKCVPVLMN